MRNLLGSMKTRTGAVVIGAGVLLTGAGVATAATISQSAPAPVEESAPVEAPEAGVVSPADETVPDAPAATVEDVTTSDDTPADAPAPAPAPAPEAVEPTPSTPYDPAAPWVDPNDAGRTYFPAPDLTVEPLPGEGQTVGG